jgi:transcription-repair coupling factor (superfamily II helicase)
MKLLLKLLQENNKFKALQKAIKAVSASTTEKEIKIGGLWGSSAFFLLAGLAERAPSWILLITSTLEEAEEAKEDLELFRPGVVNLFQPWEDFSIEEGKPFRQLLTQHLRVLHSLLFPGMGAGLKPAPTGSGLNPLPTPRARTGGKTIPNKGHSKPNQEAQKIIVCPIQALLQKLPSPRELVENTLKVAVGTDLPPEKLVKWLVDRDFRRESLVEAPGEFSLRGCILDVFPPASESPYRLEFFGDKIESLRLFNSDTQTSLKELQEANLLALKEGASFKGTCTMVDYLPQGAWVVMREPEAIAEKAEKMPHPIPWLHTYEEVSKRWPRFTRLSLSFLPFAESTHNFEVESVERFSSEHLVAELAQSFGRVNSATTTMSRRTIVFCNNEAEEKRFQELLRDEGLQLETALGRLNKGFFFKDIGLLLLSHHELFHRYRLKREPRKSVPARPLESFVELRKGDYVVHVAHGIARFLGMEELEHEGQKRECLVLEFEGGTGTRLYVSASSGIGLIQKYIGPSEHRPPLSRLGGQGWTRKLEEVEKAVADLAVGLLEMQALRQARPGIQYPPDTEWQKEFEGEFLYEETEDQLKVNREIKTDMESGRPMDRLVCGDVGYGKTELAIRAAFKAVMYGKQVAVLVPTTILAQQHFRTFSERMADYPVRVEVLSRFKSPHEQKLILEALREGAVDIVIGTHRLIQKDVAFKELGLIIIDEEQRFGVEHKERLKRLRQMVDVLTLTATPIPRTLHMSLLGLKDISCLTTPPQDRQAIKTFLMRQEEEKIRQAILFELAREGQVYFVHNRVYNIKVVAAELSRIVPEARIAVAHGQMPEKDLERRMLAFIEGKYDILVSTTIIESGVDIPNVNTVFINEADSFGLAELHQLRGRVGRYKHMAYAYLLLPRDRPISPEAEKKLKAIEEFSELGAGFKIALRDLEIRGAGNILGPQQHGHIQAVGYEMYCQLLETAVKKAKKEPLRSPIEVSINLRLDAYLPPAYIPDEALRMEMYRKIGRCQSKEEIQAVEEELQDRFGPLQSPVQNLLTERALRLAAQDYGIRSLFRTDGRLVIEVEDLKRAEACLSPLKRRIRVINENTLHLLLTGRSASTESPKEVINLLKKAFNI